MNKDMKTELPKLAMDEIPTPAADAVSITGLVKKSGKVSGYQLSDSRIVSREEGVTLAKNGQIKGVGVAHNGDTEYLKSIPDDSESNNLSSLPTVSDYS
ncbi:MAG: DUF3892 domain-containing protein [Lachnospiraceae bacterium]